MKRSREVVRRGVGTVVLVSAVLLGGCSRIESDAEPESRVVASALSAPSGAAFGFESLASWTISSGAPSLGAPRTQGQTALRLQGPVNYTTITSAPFAMTAEDIAPLTQPGAYVAIDMALSTQQPNPHWFGATQMFVSCPARGVNNQYLGQTELTGKRLGVYATYRFGIPAFVRQQLQGGGCPDFSLTFVVNVPFEGTGLYLIDNLRFKAPGDPSSTGAGASIDLVALRAASPPSSTPGAAAFAEARVQVPESFHVAQGNAGTGQLTLLLSRGASDQTTCSYTGADQGTAYRLASCSRGEQPGDLVIATSAVLTVVSSNAAAGETKIKAQLALNPTGDELVTGLTPIPTFWGDTPAQISTISAAYFNRVAALNPQDGATVTLPTPAAARGTSTVRIRDMLDPNAPPLSPTDPPFNQYGDVGGNGMANAFWRLEGFVDGTQVEPGRFTTAVQASASVGGMLLSSTLEALRINLVYNSDSGTVTPTGQTGGMRTGALSLFVFGQEAIPPISLDQSVEEDTIFEETRGGAIPVFDFGIFSINVGMSATIKVDLLTVAAFNALQFTLTPSAVLTASVSGIVNIGIASGGVTANVELLNLGLPITAFAGWDIDTTPAVCSANARFVIDSSATVSMGAGAIRAHVTFGNCDFLGLCHTESWNLTDWGPLLTTTHPFLHINETPTIADLPRSACDQPLLMAIDCVPDNEAVIAGLPIAFGSMAAEPRGQSGGPIIPPPAPIPCEQRAWAIEPSVASDQILRGGCEPIFRFGGTGPRTLTMTATTPFQTASVSKPLTIVAPTGPGPFARILNPVQGCEPTYIQGTAVTLQAAAIDPGGQDPLTFAWDYVPTLSGVLTPIGQGEAFNWITPGLLGGDATLQLRVAAGARSTTVTTAVQLVGLQ